MISTNHYPIDRAPGPGYSPRRKSGLAQLTTLVSGGISVWWAPCSPQVPLLLDVCAPPSPPCLHPCSSQWQASTRAPCEPLPSALARNPIGKGPQIPAFKFTRIPVSLTWSKHSASQWSTHRPTSNWSPNPRRFSGFGVMEQVAGAFSVYTNRAPAWGLGKIC